MEQNIENILSDNTTENMSEPTQKNGVNEQTFSIINNQRPDTQEVKVQQVTEVTTATSSEPKRRGPKRKNVTKARKFFVHDDGSIAPCGRGRPSRVWIGSIKTIDVPYDWQPGQEVSGYKLFVEEPVD